MRLNHFTSFSENTEFIYDFWPYLFMYMVSAQQLHVMEVWLYYTVYTEWLVRTFTLTHFYTQRADQQPQIIQHHSLWCVGRLLNFAFQLRCFCTYGGFKFQACFCNPLIYCHHNLTPLDSWPLITTDLFVYSTISLQDAQVTVEAWMLVSHAQLLAGEEILILTDPLREVGCEYCPIITAALYKHVSCDWNCCNMFPGTAFPGLKV